MYNELLKFLKSSKTQCQLTITKYRRNDTLLIIKYYYDDNNILLYTQFNYENDLDINKRLEYSGFYNLKSNTFYDTTYNLKDIIDIKNIVFLNELKEKIKSLVLKKCMEIIKKDFKDIDVLKSKIKLNDLDKRSIEEIKNYSSKQVAKQYFLEGKSIDDINICITNTPKIYFEHVIKYIDNIDCAIDEIANKYINDNFKNIYLNYLYTEMYKKEFLKIQNDKNNTLHLRKAIKESITDQKTVNVTIFKDDKEFSFKTDTDVFKYGICCDYYSAYNIAAKDRQKFYDLFGRSADYTASEIVKITYSKKVLYSKLVA